MAVVGVMAALVLTACTGATEDLGTADAGRYGTWSWDGSEWTRLGPVPDGFTSESSPGVYPVGSLDYWKGFGGLIATSATGWRAAKWNGVNWDAADAFPSPPPDDDASSSSLTRWPSAALFLDEAKGQLVKINSNAKTVWAWSGGTWTPVVSPKDWPQRWASGTMIWNATYDPYRHEVLILTWRVASGEKSKTWAWNGSELIERSDWPLSSYGSFCTLVPDGNEHMLAFCAAGAYSWDGKDWSGLGSVTNYCPKSSVNITDIRMAYDVAHQQLIAVGSDANGRFHTWLWQQATWKHLSTKSAPPGTGHISNLVYDPELPGLVLVGVLIIPWNPSALGFYSCPHS